MTGADTGGPRSAHRRAKVGLASLCYQRLSLGRLANYVIPKALAWDAEVS